MTKTAIIGGTGLTRLTDWAVTRREVIETPYGPPSSELIFGKLNSHEFVFLARHGDPHRFPPHKVNYRANISALKQVGVTSILAVAAVGGIGNDAAPGKIVIPNQIIDYTYGRINTFYEDDLDAVTHIDFSHPYSHKLREKILEVAHQVEVDAVDGGVYGCTQGPRLETCAEISRMERDGCTLVGMTGMPEAALAREAEIDYACLAVVANWAAGKSEAETITMEEIEANLTSGMKGIQAILREWKPV